MLTFYDYVQYYLNKAVIFEEDKVCNFLINHLKGANGKIKKTTEIIQRLVGLFEDDSSSSDLLDTIFSNNKHTKDQTLLIKNFNIINCNFKDNGFTEARHLEPASIEGVLCFFESYLEIICESIQECDKTLNYDKKT